MPIHATVKGGVVTITGSAQSRQEQQLAERIADGVRGVRLTQNELTRRADAKRDDGTVSNDVKSRLAWDVLVEHDPITATVKDAQVTLAGTVGSAAEKSRAVSDAWVDGVAKVDATALDVKWWDRPDKNLCPFTEVRSRHCDRDQGRRLLRPAGQVVQHQIPVCRMESRR